MINQELSVSEIFHSVNRSSSIPSIDWKVRALAAEKKLQNQEIIISYAKDVIAMWPQFTLRTTWKMTNLIEGLKEAINL